MWQDLETDRREKEVTPEHFQYKKFSNEETFSLRERKLR